MEPGSNKVETAVVILNWNGRKFLEKFLPRLLECTPASTARIIVADNASSDDSVEFMRCEYPGVRLILNGENGGFAKGYNDALKQVEADFYVLLNSDIEVTPHWVEPVIEEMKRNPDVAAAQPKLRSYYAKEKFEYAGAAGGFMDYLGYPFCRGRLFDTVEEDKGQYDEPCEVFWATGAAMFVRADAYWKAGGLDNDFFAHMEEIDLCWRLRNMGYKIMYYPQSVIYHIGGGTLPKSSPRKTYLNFRNNLVLLYKNLPEKQLRRVFFKRFWLDMAAAGVFLLKGSAGDFKAVFKARRDFHKAKPVHRLKRKNTRQNECMPVYKRSIVWDYNFGGKKKFSDLKFNIYES